MRSYECCVFPCTKPVKCKKAKSIKTPQKWTPMCHQKQIKSEERHEKLPKTNFT